MATADHDHYETLGVTSDATPQQVHDAYRSLIRVHRDRPGEPDPVRIERARRINIAHTILQNPVKRRQYDDSIAGPAGATLLKTPQSALPNDGWKGADFGDDSEEPMRQRKRIWYPLGVALIALGATTITLMTFYPTPIVDHLPATEPMSIRTPHDPATRGQTVYPKAVLRRYRRTRRQRQPIHKQSSLPS